MGFVTASLMVNCTDDTAHRIQEAFPPASSMRFMHSYQDKKCTSESFDKFDSLLADIRFAIQDPRVIEIMEVTDCAPISQIIPFLRGSPTGQDYFNVTSFSACPERKVHRVLAWIDNKLREAVHLVFPHGFSKKNVYQDPAK